MNLQNSKTSSKIFTISFAIAIFVLFFIASLTYNQIRSLSKSEQLVEHTFKVQNLLEQLFSLVKDAETGQRGFIITQDSTFLEPYHNSQTKINSIFQELEKLAIENPIQQQNLTKLKPIVTRRFELLKDRINSAANNRFALRSDTLKAKMLIGKVVMDILRTHLDEMIKAEKTLLAERQATQKSKIIFTPFFSLLLLCFSLLVFISSFIKINKDVEKLNVLNNELILTEESFKHAEEIANISHWQWNLENNLLTYSDNQYQLLGCKPNEFEPTVENFLKFVHPDDKHIVIKGGEKMLLEHETSDTIFRIIRKDGTLRYFKSTGKILIDNIGKKIVVGINYDITEQYLASKVLKDKNEELLQSNIELASFNHVASHDLQEPLRKIQLFISRIFEDKDLKLSEKNEDYFKRMQISANRMQLLINDLLAYSSLNATDIVFEKTDLNETVQLVLNELQIHLEYTNEKNVTVNFKNLPIIDGIPFQLKQLFNNLIENSIKYAQPIVAPIIDISATIIDGNKVPDLRANAEKKYYKISVADNGMGFEQKYAEKIFNLFQRLHDKQSFSGTGIGLAICKKIIENHQGFIFATSKLNQGTIFDVYIPL